MAKTTLTERVELLEKSMTKLTPLPGRVDACEQRIDDIGQQFLQFRAEARDEFSAIRQRLDGVDKRLDGVDQRLHGIDKRLDGFDKRFDRVDERFDAVGQRLDELKSQMLTLHEAAIERMTWIGAGRRKRR